MDSVTVNFYKTPNKVYKLGLTSNELLVLNYLLSFLNNKVINPSKATISSSIGVSKRTVDKIISSLKAKGLIDYIQGGKVGDKKYTNCYKIYLNKIDPACIIKKVNKIEAEDIFNCDKMIKEIIENNG